MSGGQRIDDHKFWAGSRSKESVLPLGSKMKQESSVGGAGSVAMYEDTDSAIKSLQEKGEKKVKSHGLKDGYRN
jgi:hypothetical protein